MQECTGGVNTPWRWHRFRDYYHAMGNKPACPWVPPMTADADIVAAIDQLEFGAQPHVAQAIG